MSKMDGKTRGKKWLRFEGKIKDILLLTALGLVLILSAWTLFQSEEKSEANMTEAEMKVARLLGEIEGVGEVNVIVCENEEEKSVVVVCDGGRDLQVIMDIREAVATALGTEEKLVKIYLKKE